MRNRLQSQAVLGVVTLLITVYAAQAQGTRSDYERAMHLRDATANTVFRDRVTPHWFAGNAKFWYRNDLAGDTREFIVVDAETGTRGPAFDHEKLAASLSKTLGKTIEANQLPIDRLVFNDAGTQLSFTCETRRWKCDLSNYELGEAPKDEQGAASLPSGRRVRPSRSTGGETAITFLNRTDGPVDVHWVDSEGQRQRYATIDAGGQHRQHTYAGHVWLVTNKAGETLGVFAATEEAGDAVISKDTVRPHGRVRTTLAAPNPRTIPRRGLAGVHQGSQRLCSRTGFQRGNGAERRRHGEGRLLRGISLVAGLAEAGRAADPQGRQAEGVLGRVVAEGPAAAEAARRSTTSSRATGSTSPSRICSTSPASGTCPSPMNCSPIPGASRTSAGRRIRAGSRSSTTSAATRCCGSSPWTPRRARPSAVVDEQSSTFIDYAGKQFSHHLDATSEIIWMSERDGWNHLYLYDAADRQREEPDHQGRLGRPRRRIAWTRRSGRSGSGPAAFGPGRTPITSTCAA